MKNTAHPQASPDRTLDYLKDYRDECKLLAKVRSTAIIYFLYEKGSLTKIELMNELFPTDSDQRSKRMESVSKILLQDSLMPLYEGGYIEDPSIKAGKIAGPYSLTTKGEDEAFRIKKYIEMLRRKELPQDIDITKLKLFIEIMKNKDEEAETRSRYALIISKIMNQNEWNIKIDNRYIILDIYSTLFKDINEVKERKEMDLSPERITSLLDALYWKFSEFIIEHKNKEWFFVDNAIINKIKKYVEIFETGEEEGENENWFHDPKICRSLMRILEKAFETCSEKQKQIYDTAIDILGDLTSNSFLGSSELIHIITRYIENKRGEEFKAEFNKIRKFETSEIDSQLCIANCVISDPSLLSL